MYCALQKWNNLQKLEKLDKLIPFNQFKSVLTDRDKSGLSIVFFELMLMSLTCLVSMYLITVSCYLYTVVHEMIPFMLKQ